MATAKKGQRKAKNRRESWGFWLTYWGTLLGWAGFGYAVIDRHVYLASTLFAIALLQLVGGTWLLVSWPRGAKTVVTILLVAGFTWGDSQWITEDHRFVRPIPAGGGALMQYGPVGVNAFHAVVNTALLGASDRYKVIVILRIVDDAVDEYADTRIEKSEAFTIDGGIKNIVIYASDQFMSRLSSGAEVRFVVAIIPSPLPSDRIRKLADVLSMGGNLVVTGGIGPIQTKPR